MFVITTTISCVIHRATYRICAYKNPQQLYDKYRELIENYAIQTVSTNV